MSSQSNTTSKGQTPATTKASGKKRYNAPRLNRFGMVTDLTAGGSTGPSENAEPKPHPDPYKKP